MLILKKTNLKYKIIYKDSGMLYNSPESEWRIIMLAIGIILIVAAVFLTIAVLMQHGKSHNLSGTIAGASETFFGKSKASTIDKKLSVLTTVVAIVFVVLVLVAYLVQGIGNDNNQIADNTNKVVQTVHDHDHDHGTTTEKKEEPKDTESKGTEAKETEAKSEDTAK